MLEERENLSGSSHWGNGGAYSEMRKILGGSGLADKIKSLK